MSHEPAMPEPPQSTSRAIWCFDGIKRRNVPKAFSVGFRPCSDSHSRVPEAEQRVRGPRETGPETGWIGPTRSGVRFAPTDWEVHSGQFTVHSLVHSAGVHRALEL